jgi:hypothetical protein
MFVRCLVVARPPLAVGWDFPYPSLRLVHRFENGPVWIPRGGQPCRPPRLMSFGKPSGRVTPRERRASDVFRIGLALSCRLLKTHPFSFHSGQENRSVFTGARSFFLREVSLLRAGSGTSCLVSPRRSAYRCVQGVRVCPGPS